MHIVDQNLVQWLPLRHTLNISCTLLPAWKSPSCMQDFNLTDMAQRKAGLTDECKFLVLTSRASLTHVRIWKGTEGGLVVTVFCFTPHKNTRTFFVKKIYD